MLVVDDSAMTRKILRSQLMHLGYSEVFEARDGGEALFKLQDKEPDLVFLDIHMPEMDGRSFMKKMQSRPELTDTPVIVVSADASPEQSRAMLKLGVRCYLTKPFAPDKLRVAIKIAMEPKGELAEPVKELKRC
jgi:CheY-like chemotaxis protein